MLLGGPAPARAGDPAAPPASPEQRAVAFLAPEVASWPLEHRCYSCHNNGDGARALYRARQLGLAVPADKLAAATAWLARPDGWEHNGPEGEFSDQKLARLQFAVALAAAAESEPLDEPLLRAAELLAADQRDDGSWQGKQAAPVGSPITWGPYLATAQATHVLRRTQDARFRPQLAAAGQWLRRQRPGSVLGAAALLLALAAEQDGRALAAHRHCLQVIAASQADDGGWGPFRTAPTEPFDTAVVVLALARLPPQSDTSERIARGRAYLLATQLDDGSWPETTRASDRESYAHRISTTAWALVALLETRAVSRRR